jgi:hypothetical protein
MRTTSNCTSWSGVENRTALIVVTNIFYSVYISTNTNENSVFITMSLIDLCIVAREAHIRSTQRHTFALHSQRLT